MRSGNDSRKLAVVAAMRDELTPFLPGLQEHAPKPGFDKRVRFYVGEHAGLPLVAAQTGLGKVNAALVVQMLADIFRPAAVVQVGLAGAVSDELEVGDIVIGNNFIQHDVDLTAIGLRPGELAFGVSLQGGKLTVAEEMRVWQSPADELLVRLAENVAAGVDLAPVAESDSGRKPRVVTGTIVSGDQFVNSIERTKWLRDTFGAAATEMEGAAAAHVCRVNGLPFVGIRAISDKADHCAQDDFSCHLLAATRNYYEIACGVIRSWPEP